jgi:hypothetical protein
MRMLGGGEMTGKIAYAFGAESRSGSTDGPTKFVGNLSIRRNRFCGRSRLAFALLQVLMVRPSL